MPSNVELLAPARDAATASAAIRHGADAVYIGAPAFGARAAASNSLDDIAKVVAEAHPFGVKVYVTLNTIIYNDELEHARKLVVDLWRIGVDAIIVQDMALLEMDIPPIDLHASTQCDSRDTDKILWLAKAGFSQIVLPREFSICQIKAARNALDNANELNTKLEVFVHGALCVSYSGDCHAGALLAGRSANRGECPQICRLDYLLTDSFGRPVKLPDGGNASRHWLSLADMNRLKHLEQLIDAGARSFKIEGRLKSAAYVKNVTAAYSQQLDRLISGYGGKFRRASFGQVEYNFQPDLRQAFNRGFTPYFIDSDAHTNITSWQTPKWVGRSVGMVVARQGYRLKIKGKADIHNGDGLGFFRPDGTYAGFRVNRVEGAWIIPAPGSAIPEGPGVELFRNADVEWESKMSRTDSARRTIAVTMRLRHLPDGRIAIDASDERGCAVSVASDDSFTDTALTPQTTQRRGVLERLGDTVYRLADLFDDCGEVFIPSKALTSLRRNAIDALDSDWRIRRNRILRKSSALESNALAGTTITYHDNVANTMAASFYEKHGASMAQAAVEVEKPAGDVRVMTTRYCIRRELGCCLKTSGADKLPTDLYLNAPIGRLALRFDCANCNMQVYIPN